ncbi:glycosyltransferase [Candidatus Omnitrophota bacterium]
MKETEMNILYIEGSGDFGGATVGLINMLKFIDRSKYKPFVVCLYSGRHVDVLRKAFVDVVVLKSNFIVSKRPGRVLSFLNTLLARFSHVMQLLFLIRRLKIKLVHCNNGVYTPGVLAVKLSGIPYIAHLRSLPGRLRLLTKFSGRFADRIVAISRAVRDCYLKQGCRFQNIIVINDGIDINYVNKSAMNKNNGFRKKFNVTSGEYIIGTVSRLSKEKGIGFLVDALPLIAKSVRDFKCFIVGDGPLLEDLKKKVNSLGFTEKVIFTGKLDNPFYVLSNFDVFVLPSIKEGLSLSIMEAMTLGVPVVATKVGGIKEIIDDGVDGLLVDEADPESLSRAVLLLIKDSNLREKIRKNSLEKSMNRFSMCKSVKKIQRIYENFVS